MSFCGVRQSVYCGRAMSCGKSATSLWEVGHSFMMGQPLIYVVPGMSHRLSSHLVFPGSGLGFPYGPMSLRRSY